MKDEELNIKVKFKEKQRSATEQTKSLKST